MFWAGKLGDLKVDENKNMLSCKVCRSNDPVRRVRVNGCDVQVCGECGLGQIRDVPPNEELSDIYGIEYFSDQKYSDDVAQRHEQRRRMARLVKVLPKGGRVLDYGCAVGDFVAGASSKYEIYGSDVSADALGLARARYPLLRERFVESTQLIEGYTGSFDAITLWDVIEHVPNPAGELDRLRRLLKPGGFLLLSTPNYSSVWSKLMGSRWAFLTPPEHLFFFTRRSITLLFEKTGFRSVEIRCKGKTVNLAFLVYKLNRKFESKLLRAIGDFVSSTGLRRIVVYVPGGDIMYATAMARSL